MCSLISVSLAQRAVDFPRLDGEGKERAILVPVDDAGLYATIGVVAADVTKGKSGADTFELLAQDPQSRITLLRGVKGNEPAAKFQSGRSLKPGEMVKRGGANAAVVSWESHFHDQLLPLSFLRVHHQGSVPAPGYPLKNEQGEIIALCHQATDAFGNGTYALPAEAVQSVVTSYQKYQKIRRSFCGINLDARDPIASIVGVRPDSPAAIAGIKKDDVLLAINTQPVTDYATAIDAFFYLVPGVEVEFKLLRGLEVKVLKVTPVIDPRHAASESQQKK